nr:MAG TPA: hypothetical protein [Caudoviricetes sp.]
MTIINIRYSFHSRLYLIGLKRVLSDAISIKL